MQRAADGAARVMLRSVDRPRSPLGVHVCPGRAPIKTYADNVPLNAFRGANALVNGKAFGALQPPTRRLWEVKTDNFGAYTPALQEIAVRKHSRELLRERDLARACGFDFRVGVRSEEHRAALEEEAPGLEGFILIMDWCRNDGQATNYNHRLRA